MKITSTSFRTVLRRLGVTPFPREPFELARTVVPVSLVDSDIILSATLLPVLGTPASAGELTAPAANTILADSGPLNAGNYAILWWVSANDPNAFRLQRRNAGNTADVWAYRMQVGTSVFSAPALIHAEVQQNERFRILNVATGTAGTVYHAVLWATLL